MNIRKLVAPVLAWLLLLASGCAAAPDAQSFPPEPPTSASEALPEKSEAVSGEAEALEAADISALKLAEAANDALRLSYPDDAWIADQGSSPLVLYYLPTYGTEKAVNVNAQRLFECAALGKEELKTLSGGFESTGNYLRVQRAELLRLDGENVIYMEAVMQITDEVIDYMLNAGGWTQEWIDQNGGRDALCAIPPTEQLYLYTAKDGWLYLFVGTYYDDSQKSALLDAITVLAQTVRAVE